MIKVGSDQLITLVKINDRTRTSLMIHIPRSICATPENETSSTENKMSWLFWAIKLTPGIVTPYRIESTHCDDLSSPNVRHICGFGANREGPPCTVTNLSTVNLTSQWNQFTKGPQWKILFFLTRIWDFAALRPTRLHSSKPCKSVILVSFCEVCSHSYALCLFVTTRSRSLYPLLSTPTWWPSATSRSRSLDGSFAARKKRSTESADTERFESLSPSSVPSLSSGRNGIANVTASSFVTGSGVWRWSSSINKWWDPSIARYENCPHQQEIW